MFDEEMMEPGASYKDYRENKDNFNTCSCNGIIPKDKPVCERNKEGLLKRTGRGMCLYFRTNSTDHCDHVTIV